MRIIAVRTKARYFIGMHVNVPIESLIATFRHFDSSPDIVYQPQSFANKNATIDHDMVTVNCGVDVYFA